MPFVGSDISSTRKRKWNNEHAEVYRLYSPEKQQDVYFVSSQPQPLSARKILPLSKRARFSDDEPYHHAEHNNSQHGQYHHRRRSSSSHNSSQYQPKILQDQPSLANRTPARMGPALLEPCHICHRKPVKRSDLDGFAECHGCGQRTCFVCIRECQGWDADEDSALSEQEVLSRSFHMDDVDDLVAAENNSSSGDEQHQDHGGGRRQLDVNEETENGGNVTGKGWHAGGHRTVVCSRCCIEKGAEGEIICLGCLSGMAGG